MDDCVITTMADDDDTVEEIPDKVTVSIPDEEMRKFIAEKENEPQYKSRSHVIQMAVRVMMRDDDRGPLT